MMTNVGAIKSAMLAKRKEHAVHFSGFKLKDGEHSFIASVHARVTEGTHSSCRQVTHLLDARIYKLPASLSSLAFPSPSSSPPSIKFLSIQLASLYLDSLVICQWCLQAYNHLTIHSDPLHTGHSNLPLIKSNLS